MSMDLDVRAAEVEIENVRAVGVADLRQLASHTVVRETGRAVHQLEFTFGGTAEVVYDESGKLRQLTTEGCGVTWSPEGMLLLRDGVA